MALYPVAGCKIFIGAAINDQKDDFDADDFTSQTWIEIDGFAQMGGIGDTAQLITTPLINRNRDTKQKGTKNAGSMACVFASIPDDPGQIALIAAEQSNSNYAFKIELNDKPATGTAPKPSIRYFIGLVMGAAEAGGDANTVRNLESTIEINSNIVRVAATSGD